jgi:hypothetical protein
MCVVRDHARFSRHIRGTWNELDLGMMHARSTLHSVTQWVEPRVKRVVAAIASCEACGEVAFGKLCSDCLQQARPHISDDPYDVIGGEGGGLT